MLITQDVNKKPISFLTTARVSAYVEGSSFVLGKVHQYADTDPDAPLSKYDYIAKDGFIHDIVSAKNVANLTVREYFNPGLNLSYYNRSSDHRSGIMDLVYCPKCLKFEPCSSIIKVTKSDSNLPTVKYELRNGYYNQTTRSKDMFNSNNKYELISLLCNKCHTRLSANILNIEPYKGTVEDEVKTAQYYIEPANSGNMSVRCVFYRHLFNADRDTLKATDTIQDRLSVDLETGKIYYMLPVPKSKWTHNRRFKDITNGNYDIPYRFPINYEWTDYTISRKSFLKLANKIYNFHKEYHNTEIPYRYYFSGMDLTSDNYNIQELLRISQYPMLSSKCYLFLRTLCSYINVSTLHQPRMSKEFKYQVRNVKKAIKYLFAHRFEITDKDVYKALNVSPKLLKNYNPVSDRNTYLTPTVKTLLPQLQDSTHRFLVTTLLDTPKCSVKKRFQDLYLIFNPRKSTNFRYIFHRYFKEIAGAKSALIEKYLIKILSPAGESLVITYSCINNVLDGFAALDITYDTVCSEDREDYVTFVDCIKANKLPTCITSFFKDVVRIGSAREFHDSCMKYADRISVGNIPITYSDAFLKGTSANNQYTLLKDGKVNEYEIVPAETTKQLSECTNNMNICTVTYWKRALDKETNIFFILNKSQSDNPLLYFEGCIEVSNSKAVVQIKGRENHTIMPELKPFVKSWIQSNNLPLSTDDLNLSDKNYIPIITRKNPYKNYIQNALRQIAH